MNNQPNNPLHGIKLEKIITDLVGHYGWEELGNIIYIQCFINDPCISSSLKFLRRTPWARKKVEMLYEATEFYTQEVKMTTEPPLQTYKPKT